MRISDWSSDGCSSDLRVVLLSALIVGVVLSCAQIVFDAYKTDRAVAIDAQRILDMFRDPSTQAVYSLDREMGMQVIEGLFRDEAVRMARSEEHTSELQSLMRNSYAVFCLKKKKQTQYTSNT